jgi:hypothetical protein
VTVKANGNSVVAIDFTEEVPTLLAWANDDGKHDPDLLRAIYVADPALIIEES